LTYDEIKSSLSMWKEFYKTNISITCLHTPCILFIHEKDVSSCFKLDIFNCVQYFILVWNKVDILIIGPCNLRSLTVLSGLKIH